MLQQKLPDSSQWNTISISAAFQFSADPLLRSYDIFMLNRNLEYGKAPHTLLLIPTPFDPTRTEVTNYYCLGLPKSFKDSNERVLSAFCQSLQTSTLSLRTRQEANRARGQSEWPIPKSIQDPKFPLSSKLTHCFLNTLGYPLRAIFSFIVYMAVETSRKGT